jgi:hypothetical protein
MPTTASVEAIVRKMDAMSTGSVDEKAKTQVQAATGLDLTADEVRRSPPRGLRWGREACLRVVVR